MINGIGFAFFAGVLSTLSPCVLPLLPSVLSTARSQNRLGRIALAAGLALSFVAIGLIGASIGFSIGLDGAVFRIASALMLLAFGVTLMIPPLQARLALATSPVGNWAEQRFNRFVTHGCWGQFGVGLLLGAVWSPCAGPTLGAATVLAARGRNLEQAVITMGLFGIGAALPLLLPWPAIVRDDAAMGRSSCRRWKQDESCVWLRFGNYRLHGSARSRQGDRDRTRFCYTRLADRFDNQLLTGVPSSGRPGRLAPRRMVVIIFSTHVTPQTLERGQELGLERPFCCRGTMWTIKTDCAGQFEKLCCQKVTNVVNHCILLRTRRRFCTDLLHEEAGLSNTGQQGPGLVRLSK